MEVRDQFCINCRSKNKLATMKKESASTKFLNEYFFEKRNKRKKIVRQRAKQLVPREENLRLGETVKLLTVATEVGIMDTSKGSLEPVRGPKLPVNVGKDVTTEKVSIFPQKPADYDQVFGGLNNYKLIYLDVELMYKDELFAFGKYKK